MMVVRRPWPRSTPFLAKWPALGILQQRMPWSEIDLPSFVCKLQALPCFITAGIEADDGR